MKQGQVNPDSTQYQKPYTCFDSIRNIKMEIKTAINGQNHRTAAKRPIKK